MSYALERTRLHAVHTPARVWPCCLRARLTDWIIHSYMAFKNENILLSYRIFVVRKFIWLKVLSFLRDYVCQAEASNAALQTHNQYMYNTTRCLDAFHSNKKLLSTPMSHRRFIYSGAYNCLRIPNCVQMDFE